MQAEALVLALLIVEAEPGADAGLGLGDRLRHSRSTKMLSMQRPLPSQLIMTPCRFGVPVKSSLVNWLPWSVLKISGRPYRASASSSASTQKSAASVLDRRHAKHRAAHPVHDDHQIEEALGHRDVGDVRAPDLIDPLDRQPAEEVRIDFVRALS